MKLIILFSIYLHFVSILNKSYALISCDIIPINLIGVKSTCENKEGFSISCHRDPLQIYKVNLQCDISNGYHNRNHIKGQIITCDSNNGQWSKNPIECLIKCNELPQYVDLFDVANRNTSSSIIEIKRNMEIFSGIVMSERKIFIKNNVTSGYGTADFNLEIRQGLGFKVFKVRTNICDKSYCVVDILKDYIKFYMDVKPACRWSFDKTFETFISTSEQYGQKEIQNEASIKCFVPTVNFQRIHIQCYNFDNNGSVIETECYDYVDVITKRCNLGFGLDQYNNQNDNLISICAKNKWNVFAEDNSCQLYCGKTFDTIKRLKRDSTVKPNVSKLIFDSTGEPIITKTPVISDSNDFTIENIQFEVNVLDSPIEVKVTKKIVNQASHQSLMVLSKNLHPWNVGVYSNNTEFSTSFEQICGGTIIHSNLVISAAHCFWNIENNELYSEEFYLIGAGKYYREFNMTELGAVFVAVKKVFVPDFYLHSSNMNDIAVVVLKQDLQFTHVIQPVCIEFEDLMYYEKAIGIQGIAVGWGDTSANDYSSSVLRYINLTTLSKSECRNLVPAIYRPEIKPDKFCATNENQSASCQGDSGGGFITKKYIETGEERFFINGVVSVGLNPTKYCSDGFISLFTDIQYYQDFIKRIYVYTRSIKFV